MFKLKHVLQDTHEGTSGGGGGDITTLTDSQKFAKACNILKISADMIQADIEEMQCPEDDQQIVNSLRAEHDFILKVGLKLEDGVFVSAEDKKTALAMVEDTINPEPEPKPKPWYSFFTDIWS